MNKLIALMLAVAVHQTAFAATPTTGSLRGTIVSPAGDPIALARIALAGAGIGRRATETDSRGAWRLALLPPGKYTLAIDAPGFERIARPDVSVALGSDLVIDVELRPAMSAAIEVTAPAPTVDVFNAHVATNITAGEFTLLPTRRDFQLLTTIAPGVMIDARNALSPTVSGSTHLENDYVVEGLSTRDPRYGNSATNLTIDFVDEVQVITMNAAAEYGHAMGGVFNVVTRSGTSELQGTVSAYFENPDWGSDNVTSEFRGSGTRELGRKKLDCTLSLGGPLLTDRAWFFGAIGPRRDTNPVELYDTGLNAVARKERTTDAKVYAGKITFAATPAHLLTFSAFGNPTENGGWQGDVLWDETAARFTDHSGSENLTLRYQGSLSNTTWMEATAGRHSQSLYTEADTEIGSRAPFQIDYTSNVFGTFVAHGGVLSRGRDDAERRLLALRATHVLFGHELRAGVEHEDNRYDAFRDDDFIGFYGPLDVPDVGKRDTIDVWTQSEDGYGTNDSWAAFVDDRFSIGHNINVIAGLRWERQTISSGRGVKVLESLGPKGQVTWRQESGYTFDRNFAPRLGIVWDPTGHGRSKVFAAAGRYFESIPLNVNVAFLNGFGFEGTSYYSTVPQTSESWFNPNGSPLNENWIPYDDFGQRHNDGIAPGTRLQYQDEYSLGGELQIGANTTAGARVVSRRIGRVLDDRGNWNPANLRARATDFVLINPGEGEYGSMFEKPRRDHTALELTLNRRLSDRWQLFSSFVAARSRGDYDGFVEYSSTMFAEGRPNTAFGYDLPRIQQNSYGRLRGDRPYQLKVQSSYSFASGFTLSESFFYSAGIPISAFAAPGFSQGKRAHYLTPRGSMGRTPDYWSLDLHAEYTMPLSFLHATSASLIADVFNVTDNHEVLEMDEAYVVPGMPGIAQWTAASNRDEWGFIKYNADFPASPYYKTARLYQSPRGVQLGVRLRF